MHYLGVDVGGTDVKLGLCTADGEVLGRRVLPTEPGRGASDALERIGAASTALMDSAGPAVACGVGVPGPLDVKRQILIGAANLPGWRGVPIPERLGARLGMPTFLENDANCAAWGEYRLGAGRGARSLVLYTLGTGVGGGIVLGGEVWVGAGGGAGRLGHVAVDPEGLPCGCGQRGCLEQYASASSVARRFGRGSARDAFAAAGAGDPAALQAVDLAGTALARAIAGVIQILQPEVVVLGGGMAAAGDLLLDRVRAGVRQRLTPRWLEATRIELAALGPDAGWLGAALWARRQSESAA